jgi:predicted DNA-binding transcriptional regulator AlpA
MMPDYCSKATIAKRLDMSTAALEQLLKRGLFPAPVTIGDHERWSWEAIDTYLRSGQHGTEEDAVLRAIHGAKAPPVRGEDQKAQRKVVLLPATSSRNDQR